MNAMANPMINLKPQPAAPHPHRESEAQPALPPHFTVAGLNFFYGETQALHDISLTVPEHTITAFIGPSGCGKSTFLRTLNRMYETLPRTRTTGTVTLRNESIKSMDATLLRRRVGMVFQRPNPFPKSIFENVAYGVRLEGNLNRAALAERVEQSLHRAALWDEVKDKLKQSALSLSGGQQQRLCIARAVALRPDVLLLDEPTSALDPISTSRIEQLIAELKRDYTIVIVTHNMQQAARVSDYTAFMYLGDLIEHGSTETIFSNPIKQQTEDYITGRFG